MNAARVTRSPGGAAVFLGAVCPAVHRTCHPPERLDLAGAEGSVPVAGLHFLASPARAGSSRESWRGSRRGSISLKRSAR